MNSAKQSGAAALVLMLVLMLAAGGALLTGSGVFDSSRARASSSQATLDQARELLIASLVSPRDDTASGLRPGDWTIMPDLPTAPDAGDPTEPNYDGLSDGNGLLAPQCAFNGWTPGAALQSVQASGANARCFGRLPWKTMGLALPAAASGNLDQDAIPWVVISPNLLARAACMPQLTPSIAGLPWTGYGCPRALPYPWLRVVNERGVLVSDRVAFALVMPGPVQVGQTRTQGSGPAGWLDSLTVAAGCEPPCAPGTFSHAAISGAAQPTTLIQADPGAAGVDRSRLYAEPIVFNDRLVFVTIDEIMRRIEPRARAELKRAADAFDPTRMPWAVPIASPNGCPQQGLTAGMAPAMPAGGWGCGFFIYHPPVPGPPVGIPPVPGPMVTPPPTWVPLPGLVHTDWYTAGGWDRYFHYAVATPCAQGAGCAGGLILDGNAQGALAISPGSPIRNVPFSALTGAAQAPISTFGVNTTNLLELFEQPENVDGNQAFSGAAPNTGPGNDTVQVLR